MTPWILAGLGLWLAQTFYAASFKTVLAADPDDAIQDHFRGKDQSVALSVHGARAQRAQQNLLESMLVFLPLALLLEFKGITEGLAMQGAIVFLAGRMLYVPAYHLALPGLRTLTWTVAVAGLGMMTYMLLA